MTFPNYSTGTVSVAANGTVVTGVGSIWSGVNARPGDTLQIGDFQTIIADVTDVTHLSIPPWGGGAQSAVAYTIWQNSPLRFAGGQAMADVSTLVAALNTNGFYVFVDPSLSAPDPSLGEDSQYAFQATTGKLWQKTGGAWNFIGIFKGFGVPAPWSSSTAYLPFDVATLNGSSYVCILANTNQTPPNATYWTVLAGVGATGPAPIKPIAAWVTATAYVTGPPASYVSINGSSYECLTAHTSGTFATDLAAGKWGLVAQAGIGYGGSSATSFAIGTGSKAFTTTAGLAYQVGNYVRAASAAGGANFMEGPVTAYSGTTLTINITKTGGSGTHTDWNFSVSGVPGAGDMLSTNNLSDLANAATARTNLGLGTAAVRADTDFPRTDTAQTLTAAQQEQVRANIGSSVGVPDVIVEEQQTSGTAAGTATAATLITRALNTLVRNNNSIASLASNQVTLGPGTYYFEWSAPALFVAQHQSRLQNITAATIAGTGTAEYSGVGNPDVVSCRSVGSCVVTIAVSSAFALIHRVTVTRATNGLGAPCTFGTTEVYSRLEITKLG